MTKILAAVLLMICAGQVIGGDVGVSITVGQPGFFGQITLGNFPQPQLVYSQPVVIRQAPEFVSAEPIYLHVPPGHERHWRKHCAQYNACGRRVYFVRDDWYNNEYVPRFQHERADREHGEGNRGERDHGDRDHGDRDPGRGHGNRDHDEGHDR